MCDDIFLVFSSHVHVPLFLNHLNPKHVNVKLASDVRNNVVLPFLDIAIKRLDNSFETSVYRKPTFTGLCSKYNPIILKLKLINTLTSRAFKSLSN